MGVNSLPKTVTRHRRDCDLNQGPSAPQSGTLATRLPSHRTEVIIYDSTQSAVCYRLSADIDSKLSSVLSLMNFWFRFLFHSLVCTLPVPFKRVCLCHFALTISTDMSSVRVYSLGCCESNWIVLNQISGIKFNRCFLSLIAYHYFGTLLLVLYNVFTVRRYASAVYVMGLCLSLCHKSVSYQNG